MEFEEIICSMHALLLPPSHTQTSARSTYAHYIQTKKKNSTKNRHYLDPAII